MKHKEIEALKEYRKAFFNTKHELAQIYLAEVKTNKPQKEQIMRLYSNMKRTRLNLEKILKEVN